MRCEDVLRFLSPYMDSELDPRTSFEVGEHLERCADCARRFAAEIALERDLHASLARGATGPEDAAAWERITAAVRREAAPSGRSRVTRRALLALAAAVLAIVGTVGWTLARRPPPSPLGALGKAACHSHDGYIDGTERPEVATVAPTEVTAFFRSQLGLELGPLAGLDLVGARRCAFGPVHVAYVMGHRGREPVSAFVLPARDLDAFPEARAALERGDGQARAQIHGHAMFLATRGDLAVCIVASPAAGDLSSTAMALLAP